MKIVSFDLATVTGWAVLDTEHMGIFDGGHALSSGARSFRLERFEKEVARNLRAMRFFRQKIPGAAAVFYERIQFQHKSMQAARVYFGLETALELVCHELGIEAHGAHPHEIKREAGGKGNALKRRLLELARIQFPEQRVRDDNQADALWLLRVGARKMNIDMGQHVEELPLGKG